MKRAKVTKFVKIRICQFVEVEKCLYLYKVKGVYVTLEETILDHCRTWKNGVELCSHKELPQIYYGKLELCVLLPNDWLEM